MQLVRKVRAAPPSRARVIPPSPPPAPPLRPLRPHGVPSAPQIAFQAQSVTPVEENDDFTEDLRARSAAAPSRRPSCRPGRMVRHAAPDGAPPAAGAGGAQAQGGHLRRRRGRNAADQGVVPVRHHLAEHGASARRSDDGDACCGGLCPPAARVALPTPPQPPGPRQIAACILLEEVGYTGDVRYVESGWNGWFADGLPGEGEGDYVIESRTPSSAGRSARGERADALPALLPAAGGLLLVRRPAAGVAAVVC